MYNNSGNVPICFGSWEASQMAIRSFTINFSKCSVSADLLYVGSIICNDPVLNIKTRFLIRGGDEWIADHTIKELWGDYTTTARFKKIIGDLMIDTFSPIFNGLLAGEKTWIKIAQQFSRTN